MTAEETRIARLEHLRQVNMEQYGFGPNIMKRIRICGECGCPSESGKENCLFCGVRLPQETLYEQYKRRHPVCPRCDTVLAGYMQFCPQCGAKIQMKKH